MARPPAGHPRVCFFVKETRRGTFVPALILHSKNSPVLATSRAHLTITLHAPSFCSAPGFPRQALERSLCTNSRRRWVADGVRACRLPPQMLSGFRQVCAREMSQSCGKSTSTSSSASHSPSSATQLAAHPAVGVLICVAAFRRSM